jgi:hypothetical protein
LTTDLALTVAPFIIRTIHSSSPQGLANMLWSYAKLPVSPPEVIAALMNQITEELVQSIHSEGHKPFDAQVGQGQPRCVQLMHILYLASLPAPYRWGSSLLSYHCLKITVDTHELRISCSIPRLLLSAETYLVCSWGAFL